MADTKPRLKYGADWETPCPVREDKIHCDCWYLGERCCACADLAGPEARGESPVSTAINDVAENIVSESE